MPSDIQAAIKAPARPALVDHCLELLAPLGRMRAARMFGGWALYADNLCVALVLHDQLYLKADEARRALFARPAARRLSSTARAARSPRRAGQRRPMRWTHSR